MTTPRANDHPPPTVVVAVAHWLAGPSLRSGRLVRILEAHERRSHGIVAVLHTHHGSPTPRVRVFLDEGKAQLTPPPWE